jgi:hypothetical protein
VEPEAAAQAHYWLGRALAEGGEPEAAARERELARAIIRRIESSLAGVDRDSFVARTRIRQLLEQS